MIPVLRSISKMDLELFYHPQQSCEGYVFTPVCDSVNRDGGAGCLPKCMLGYTPPDQKQTPPGPEADTPQTRGRHTPRSDIPGSDTPQVRHPPRSDTPEVRQPPGSDSPPGDGHCCAQYASYWNAFLLFLVVRSLMNQGGSRLSGMKGTV